MGTLHPPSIADNDKSCYPSHEHLLHQYMLMFTYSVGSRGQEVKLRVYTLLFDHPENKKDGS